MDIRSKIQKSVSIVGTLEFNDNLYFDGQLDGSIISSGELTIGPNAIIKGKIQVNMVIVMGHVKGDLFINNSCYIEDQATVEGDIESGTLRLDEGAIFNGRAKIVRPKNQKTPAKKKKSEWNEPQNLNLIDELIHTEE